MSLFKHARSITIPDEAVDTKSWLSDEMILSLFFDPDTVSHANLMSVQLSSFIESPVLTYDETEDTPEWWSHALVSLGEAA